MSFSVDNGPLRKFAQLLGIAPKEIIRRNAQSAFKICTDALSKLKREYRRAAETTDTATVRRTGALYDSYDFRVEEKPEAVEAEFGVLKAKDGKTLAAARVLEHDGTTTITAKGKYLAVPLAGAKTAKGVARGGPRDFTNTFVMTGLGGSPLIVQQLSKGQIIPLFVLKRKVNVKGRPAVIPIANGVIKPLFDAAIKENIDEVFRRAA